MGSGTAAATGASASTAGGGNGTASVDPDGTTFGSGDPIGDTAQDDDTDAGAETDTDTDADSTGVDNGCPRVQIDVGQDATLNVRPDPSTQAPPVGSLADGTIVDVLDEVAGEDVDGNDLWYEIETGQLTGYVSAVFAVCTADDPPDLDPTAYYLPLPCGMSSTITQGNNGGTSHTGTSAFAFDFSVPLGTPLVAIAAGTVTLTFDETGPGDPCYDGGDASCANFANYVVLQHADASQSTYWHLNQVDVSVGDMVGVGEPVGLSGSTGWSTGRHAHVMRMENCGGGFCQSIPLAFNDVPGDGVPVTGDGVTSGNCP